MSKNFSSSERKIVSLFKEGSRFNYAGTQYVVEVSDKPTSSSGEPKTDIYLLTRSTNGTHKEFKISFKQENANFLENKTSAERAELILGENWASIIARSTQLLEQQFKSRNLIYKVKDGRTEEGSITVGWKFELLNVLSGQLSSQMQLSRNQVLDVYSGSNLPLDKKNAFVKGQRIANSGVANFIIFEDRPITNVQEAANSLIKIEDYVDQHPTVFFACKALNYRSLMNKWDGNRPLAVYIEWRVSNGKLTPNFVFNNPLNVGGNRVVEQLKAALRELNVSNTKGLNSTNVAKSANIRT